MGKGSVSSPTTSGKRGIPPGTAGGRKPGSKTVLSPTTMGSKGIPPRGGAGSHKAPRD